MSQLVSEVQRNQEFEQHLFDEPIEDMQVQLPPELLKYINRKQYQPVDLDWQQNFDSEYERPMASTQSLKKLKVKEKQRPESPQKVVERLYAFKAKADAKREIERTKKQQQEDELCQTRPLVNSHSESVPLYMRVEKVLNQKERRLETKKQEIAIAKEKQMREQGQMTEDEILNLKREKDARLQTEIAQSGIDFQERYKRKMVEYKLKQMQRQITQAEELKKQHTFKPDTNNRDRSYTSSDDSQSVVEKQKINSPRKKPKQSDGLIYIPSSNRVEDRLMEQGKIMSDRKERHRQMQTPTFQPILCKKSVTLAIQKKQLQGDTPSSPSKNQKTGPSADLLYLMTELDRKK